MMSTLSRVRSLVAGCAVLGALVAAGPAGAAGAAMPGHTYALHGAGQFSKAMGSAVVTQMSKGDFKVTITAEHLPSPSMLHVMPARHAYIAWIVNGPAKKNGMGATAHIALMLDKKTGNYTAKGTVMIAEVTGLSITAEPSAMSHAPAMPEVTALSSIGHGSM